MNRGFRARSSEADFPSDCIFCMAEEGVLHEAQGVRMRHRVTIKKGRGGGYRVSMKTREGKVLCGIFMDLGVKPESEERLDALKQASALVDVFAEAVREKLSGPVE